MKLKKLAALSCLLAVVIATQGISCSTAAYCNKTFDSAQKQAEQRLTCS